MFTDDVEAFQHCEDNDRWVYNKLEVALLSRLDAAPRGIPVPREDWYVVRPVYSLLGMGSGARMKYMRQGEELLKSQNGEFWCEYLEGRHLSVDYRNGFPLLCVLGKKENTLWKWDTWTKRPTHEAPALPEKLHQLSFKYTINVEFINKIPIEVHLRHNPDFEDHGFDELVVVWEIDGFNRDIEKWYEKQGYVFLDKPDDTLNVKRLGFFAR
jgi:hypothetical protein